jgi:hypothetical protein
MHNFQLKVIGADSLYVVRITALSCICRAPGLTEDFNSSRS